MKRKLLLIAILLGVAAATPAPASAANTQLLVQANLSAPAMSLVCLLRGCQVTQAVSGSPSNLFVLSVSSSANVTFLVNSLRNVPGILSVTVSTSGSTNPVGNRYIVRTTGGLLNLNLLCLLDLCQILGV